MMGALAKAQDQWIIFLHLIRQVVSIQGIERQQMCRIKVFFNFHSS